MDELQTAASWFAIDCGLVPELHKQSNKAAVDSTPSEIHLKLVGQLKAHGFPFREYFHPPTRTSEESAQYRGVLLSSGAKALVLQAKDDVSRWQLEP